MNRLTKILLFISCSNALIHCSEGPSTRPWTWEEKCEKDDRELEAHLASLPEDHPKKRSLALENEIEHALGRDNFKKAAPLIQERMAVQEMLAAQRPHLNWSYQNNLNFHIKKFCRNSQDMGMLCRLVNLEPDPIKKEIINQQLRITLKRRGVLVAGQKLWANLKDEALVGLPTGEYQKVIITDENIPVLAPALIKYFKSCDE